MFNYYAKLLPTTSPSNKEFYIFFRYSMDTIDLHRLLFNWSGSSTMDDNDVKLAICKNLKILINSNQFKHSRIDT